MSQVRTQASPVPQHSLWLRIHFARRADALLRDDLQHRLSSYLDGSGVDGMVMRTRILLIDPPAV
jgi:hypothetical protein